MVIGGWGGGAHGQGHLACPRRQMPQGQGDPRATTLTAITQDRRTCACECACVVDSLSRTGGTTAKFRLSLRLVCRRRRRRLTALDLTTNRDTASLQSPPRSLRRSDTFAKSFHIYGEEGASLSISLFLSFIHSLTLSLSHGERTRSPTYELRPCGVTIVSRLSVYTAPYLVRVSRDRK